MTAPTVAVTVRLADFGGPARAGIKVTARLSDVDYTADGTFVSTEPVTGVTDVTGTAVLNVFPNAVGTGLGTRGTTVLFAASIPGSRGLKVEAVVPNSACNLVNIITNSVPVSLTDAQAAVLQAQASAALTSADRTQTGLDRTQTGLDRIATGQDRTQTGLDVVAAGASVNAAASSAASADLSRQLAAVSDLSAAANATAGAASALQVQTATAAISSIGYGFSFFVSTASGNDSYAGNTPSTPKKTFASVIALGALLAGLAVGVARGSRQTSEVTITSANARFGSYGSSSDAAPIYDDSKVPAGTWAATVARTNVWEQVITLPGNTKIRGNVFVDGVIMSQVTSIALCESTPGSAFVSDWNAATPTLYVQSTTNPNTNGKEYRHSFSCGLNITGDGAVVTDATFQRNGHQDGALRINGENAVVRRVTLKQGCRHVLYFGAGATVEDCTLQTGYNVLEAPGTANLGVCNQPTVVGKSYTTRRNTLDAGGLANVTGWDQHGGVSTDLFDAHTHEDETYIGLSSCESVLAVLAKTLRPIWSSCKAHASISVAGTKWIVTGGNGSLNRLYDASAGAQIISARNTAAVADLGAASVGFYRCDTSPADVTLNITGDHLTIAECSASNAQVIRHARGPITCFDSTFDQVGGRTLAAPIDTFLVAGFSAASTYAGDRNVFPFGSSFTLNGTTYTDFAAWQAAGNDPNSSCAQPKAATYSDAFTRADENLENTSWTRTGGAAAQAAVRTNQLACIGTTMTLYSLGAMSSADHAVRFTVAGVPATAGPYVVLRAIDQNNWIGVRWNATQWQIGFCVAGAVTAASLSSSTVAPTVGQDIIFAIRTVTDPVTGVVTDKVWLYLVGTGTSARTMIGRSTLAGVSTLRTATLVGVVPRGTAVNPFIDDFKGLVL